MNENEWLDLFDINCRKFKWFFIEYGFTKEWYKLEEYKKERQVGKMLVVMNDVWFKLPDTVFNIKVNPKGWREFLTLIEN